MEEEVSIISSLRSRMAIKGTRTSEEPTSDQPTAVEASKESKEDKNEYAKEEKMDTSGSPQSPWGDTVGEPAGDPVLGNIHFSFVDAKIEIQLGVIHQHHPQTQKQIIRQVGTVGQISTTLILDNLTELPRPKVAKTQKKWKQIHFQRLLSKPRVSNRLFRRLRDNYDYVIQVMEILQNHQIQRNKNSKFSSLFRVICHFSFFASSL